MTCAPKPAAPAEPALNDPRCDCPARDGATDFHFQSCAVFAAAPAEPKYANELRPGETYAQMVRRVCGDPMLGVSQPAAPADPYAALIERWGFSYGTACRMEDGYWTPWHEAAAALAAQQERIAELERERHEWQSHSDGFRRKRAERELAEARADPYAALIAELQDWMHTWPDTRNKAAAAIAAQQERIAELEGERNLLINRPHTFTGAAFARAERAERECEEARAQLIAWTKIPVAGLDEARAERDALRQAGEMLHKRVDHIGCKNCGHGGRGDPCPSCIEAVAAWDAAIDAAKERP